MRVEKDYEELLDLLNRHEVRYCIIGAYALALHAKPRYTKDMDILVDASPDNAARIMAVLKEFGFGSVGLTEADFLQHDSIVQLGYEPVRVDFIAGIKGISFDEIWLRRVTAEYGDTTANFIDLDNLIRTKRIANRSQDRADIELLLRVKRSQNA